MTSARTGAHSLLIAAHSQGARVCFANPGTTELALVRALDDIPEVRPVLGLFEGVCTGAADGYARVSGVPALTLLHLGPGLANGLANLHNARRAHSQVVNVVGDHATWHLPFDAPLTSDIESLARTVSAEVLRLDSVASIAGSVYRAIEKASTPPGSVTTLVAPSDVMEAPAGEAQPGAAAITPFKIEKHPVPADRIAAAARRLATCESPILLVGGDALTADAQRVAARIAGTLGARLIMESYPAVVSLGEGLPRLERLAYFPADVREQLGKAEVLLVGARAPVSYFGYAGEPSELVSAERLIALSAPGEDALGALKQLAAMLPSRPGLIAPAPSKPSASRVSELSPVEVAEALVQSIPEDAIVSVEGSTCAAPYFQRAYRAKRHRAMTNTGGAIGQGLPCALGAAIAQPGARLLCLQSDGSAQYTLQALWTIAREALDVTIVICANHRYGILQTELQRAGARIDGPACGRLTGLEPPRIDWVALARGYGVPGTRAATSAQFSDALSRALASSGPYLIEAQLG